MSAYIRCDSDLCQEKIPLPCEKWWFLSAPRKLDFTGNPIGITYHCCSAGCLSYWAITRAMRENTNNA